MNVDGNMSKSTKNNIRSILKRTQYIGSVSDKIIHSTSNPCQEAYKIAPDERWYIGEIPNDGNYIKCPECFPGKSKSYD